jgi:FixJ family two-component response regulator
MSKTVVKRRPAPAATGSIPLSAFEDLVGETVARARERYERLTPREQEAATLMAAGMPNREIAAKLGISPKTLDIHRANLTHKLEARSSAEVANLVNLIRLADGAK